MPSASGIPPLLSTCANSGFLPLSGQGMRLQWHSQSKVLSYSVVYPRICETWRKIYWCNFELSGTAVIPFLMDLYTVKGNALVYCIIVAIARWGPFTAVALTVVINKQNINYIELCGCA